MNFIPLYFEARSLGAIRARRSGRFSNMGAKFNRFRKLPGVLASILGKNSFPETRSQIPRSPIGAIGVDFVT